MKIVVTTLFALSFLSACSEESQSSGESNHASPAVAEKTLVQPQQQQTDQSIEATAKALAKMLKQQKDTFDTSLDELNHAIEEVSKDYDDNLDFSEKNINSLAEKLGKLARQAGEGAKKLEKTGKVLGDAIQKGFEEGYQQSPESKQ